MKKYIGITLITASMLVMGCSSDDDASDTAGMTDTGETDTGETDTGETDTGETDTGETDTGETDTGETDTGETDTGETDTGETDTGETDTGETDGGGTNSYRATSMMGVMAADSRLTSIAAAMNPDFDQNLDTAAQGWTVFAPTNDAINTAVSGGAEVTTAVLQSHIYTQGGVASGDLVVGNTISMSNNSVYTITSNGAGGLQIGGVDIIEADLAVDNGALHIIDGVLLPQ